MKMLENNKTELIEEEVETSESLTEDNSKIQFPISGLVVIGVLVVCIAICFIVIAICNK